MRAVNRFIVAATAGLCLLLILAACTSQSAQHTHSSLSPDIQAQLDSMQSPQGVDPSAFEQLKAELGRQLALRGKTASTPPLGALNAPANIGMTSIGAGVYTLHWEYRNLGDYDQNGTVGVTDITPLAVHYGHQHDTDGLDAVIDVDNNGVGISDVTPIAQNFGVNCASWDIESSPSSIGPWSVVIYDVMFNSSSTTGGTAGWKEASWTGTISGSDYYRVVPVDGDGAYGEPSSSIAAATGNPPAICDVQPQTGQTGTVVYPVATNTGDAATSWSWDFGGGASPNTSTDASPAITLGAPGSYPASVTLTNAVGSDTYNYTLTVSEFSGNPPVITAVQPHSGQTGTVIYPMATNTGDPAASWSWDFGGGATPNTSSEISPAITLGAPGSYFSSVTLTNAAGSDTFNFSLIVSEFPGNPPVILNVQPRSGQTGYIISPIVTSIGDPVTSWVWNFGGGATPNTSSEISPAITLGAPGDYSASVTVTNAAGNDTFNFTLSVNPPPAVWNTYRIVSGSKIGSHINFSLINGMPAFAYIEDATYFPTYVRATTAVPASVSDWASPVYADDYPTVWYREDVALTEDDYHHPVILGYDWAQYDSAFAIIGNNSTPSSSSDWSVRTITMWVDEVGSLAMVHGQLAATYKKADGLYYAETLVYPPVFDSDWFEVHVDATAGAGEGSKLKYNADDDSLYIFSYNETDGSLNISRCPWADRGTAASWVNYVGSSSTGDSSGESYDFAFDPSASSNNMFYIYTNLASGFTRLNDVLGFEGTSNSDTYSFGLVASGAQDYGQACSLAFGAGKAVCSYVSPDGNQLVFNSTPFTTGSLPSGWAPQVVTDSAPVSSVDDTNLLVYNNTDVMIVYWRPDGIYFATLPIT